MILLDHLVKRLVELADQRAADAAGTDLIDLYAGVLQEAAVNADLAELVLDQHQFLSLEALVQELFDQGRLSGSEETGNNIDLRHDNRYLLLTFSFRTAGPRLLIRSKS